MKPFVLCFQVPLEQYMTETQRIFSAVFPDTHRAQRLSPVSLPPSVLLTFSLLFDLRSPEFQVSLAIIAGSGTSKEVGSKI